MFRDPLHRQAHSQCSTNSMQTSHLNKSHPSIMWRDPPNQQAHVSSCSLLGPPYLSCLASYRTSSQVLIHPCHRLIYPLRAWSQQTATTETRAAIFTTNPTRDPTQRAHQTPAGSAVTVQVIAACRCYEDLMGDWTTVAETILAQNSPISRGIPSGSNNLFQRCQNPRDFQPVWL